MAWYSMGCFGSMYMVMRGVTWCGVGLVQCDPVRCQCGCCVMQ